MKKSVYRITAMLSLALSALMFTGTALAVPIAATLYRNAGCQCCEQYAAYLDKQGYDVKVVNADDIAAFNRKHGVASELASCHTLIIGRHVVVGHVPEPAIAKLLRGQPNVKGIALPGMPMGSPGMPGEKQGPFVVRTLSGATYASF